MTEFGYQEDPRWKEILQRLSEIRDREAYDAEEVEFIREHLKSMDDRIRGGAALAAEGCLFEPYILDSLIQIVEEDPNEAVRKAAIQTLKGVIYEGVMQDMERDTGADTSLDDAEEWQEFQEGSLQDDYNRVKYALLNILEDVTRPSGLREAALIALSDLGFRQDIREWIEDFINSGKQSSRLVALHAMGKYPQYWENYLIKYISPETDKALLLEAISASYSSSSAQLARQIEKVLKHPDPDVIIYALMTLANINKTENLGEILQKFSLHADPRVQEAARDAIEHFSKKNFGDLMEEFGFSDE